MILILSTDGDLSSDLVIQELKCLGHDYFRLNSHDLLKEGFEISLDKHRPSFLSSGRRIYIKDIYCVWYRKFSYFRSSVYYETAVTSIDKHNLDAISREFTCLLGAIIGLVRRKNWLTNAYSVNINKFDVLCRAQELGLSIPTSRVISKKAHIKELSNLGELISKSSHDPWIVVSKKKSYSMFTRVIDDAVINKIPSDFFPSFVQSKVEKLYEVRVFILMGKLYSMAIFSQQDAQTEVDYRQYNYDRPNRNVPYTLPADISDMLIKLTKSFRLNCCSVDLIKGKDLNYYFLEINTTGQFGMVDFPCNYGLHKKVAQTLIQMDQV